VLCQLLFADVELKNVNPQRMLHQKCHISLEEICLSARNLSVCQLFILFFEMEDCPRKELLQHVYCLLLSVFTIFKKRYLLSQI